MELEIYNTHAMGYYGFLVKSRTESEKVERKFTLLTSANLMLHKISNTSYNNHNLFLSIISSSKLMRDMDSWATY